MQRHIGGSNDTNFEYTIDSLYIGRNYNDSGHWVFKLDTKQQVLMNRITPIPMINEFVQI